MRHTKSIAIAAAAFATAGFAQAETKIDTEFHVGYNTEYVWRGQALGADATEYGFDLSGACDCGLDWSAGIWYINPADTIDHELDIYAGISKDLGFGTLGFGFIHYDTQVTSVNAAGASTTADADTTELYLSYSAEVGGINLGAAVYYDIQGADATTWGEISADYSQELTESATATIGLNAGTTLDSQGGDGYTTVGASISVDFAISEDLTLSTYVAGELTSNEASGGVAEGDELFGGASLAFSF